VAGHARNGVVMRPSYWWLSVPHSEADSTFTTTQPGRAGEDVLTERGKHVASVRRVAASRSTASSTVGGG
jgi:hypothetical protein